MDAVDSDDSDVEMAFIEEVSIPFFRQQRKPPVPRHVPLKLKTNEVDISRHNFCHKNLNVIHTSFLSQLEANSS